MSARLSVNMSSFFSDAVSDSVAAAEVDAYFDAAVVPSDTLNGSYKEPSIHSSLPTLHPTHALIIRPAM